MNKGIVLILLVFSFSFNLFAQKDGLSIGLTGSLEGNKYFSSEFFNPPPNYNSHLANSYGLGVLYETKGKLFFESGLTYFSQGFDMEYNVIFRDPGDPNIPNYTEYKLKYFRIPLQVGYSLFENGRWTFNPSIGLTTAFEVNNKTNTYYMSGRVEEGALLKKDLNKIQFGINLKLGLDLDINDKFHATISPIIGKGFNKLDKDYMESGQLTYGGSLNLYMRL